ncbi:MAG: 4-phosphopantetheinyl transferase psf [Pseudomonadota bacterium]|jgi:4'-phosphopantetheinyl transferase
MRVLHGPRLRGIVAPIVPTDDSSWFAVSPGSLQSVLTTLPTESCSVWLADLDEWAESDPDQQECLDRFDRERAMRKPEGRVRHRFISSRVALRRILGALLCVQPASLRFAIDEHGKPTLTTPHQHCHFNLSHSGSALLVATSLSARIGVDIEVPRSVPRALQLSKRVFTADEQSLLIRANEISEAARDEMFLQIWTRKEAYLKCRGVGFTTPARDHAVGLDSLVRLDGFEIRSLDLPASGYAALASAAPVNHIRRYRLCRVDTI